MDRKYCFVTTLGFRHLAEGFIATKNKSEFLRKIRVSDPVLVIVSDIENSMDKIYSDRILYVFRDAKIIYRFTNQEMNLLREYMKIKPIILNMSDVHIDWDVMPSMTSLTRKELEENQLKISRESIASMRSKLNQIDQIIDTDPSYIKLDTESIYKSAMMDIVDYGYVVNMF